jgi:hypothetical protein
MTNKTLWTSGCGRIEFHIRLDDAKACSHAGQCDSDVTWLRQQPYIIEQTNALDALLLADILREYGAWDDGDLANHDANLDRIVWIACCDISEYEFE